MMRQAICSTSTSSLILKTSEVLLRQHRNWTRACARPRWLKVGASRTNLGETMQRALEADGAQLLDIPKEAHEQAGRAEVHGRYFEDLLPRVIPQIRPETKAEWTVCVVQTMEANNSLIRRCGFRPFQIALGRDAEVPGDLLQKLSRRDQFLFGVARSRGSPHCSNQVSCSSSRFAIQ